jgi:hypothetical protein
MAIATDGAAALPIATGLPVLDLNDADAIARFVLDNAARCEYLEPTPAPVLAGCATSRGVARPEAEQLRTREDA